MSSTVDVVVVGAGASGIAAAVAAASSGSRVVLLDEQNEPGGWQRTSIKMIERPPEMIPAMRGKEAAQFGAVRLAESDVEFRPNSVVWGLFEDRTLAVFGPNGAYQLQPENIILATGSTEIVWPFAGWTLPGVMTARPARQFMHLHRVLPGERAAVIGQGDDADRMVLDLELAGVQVVARAESPDGVEAGGANQVEWVAGDGEREEADVVILALGSLPDPELARHAMAEMTYSASNGCHVPVRNDEMATTVDGVYVVGDAGGLTTFAESVTQGLVAGYAAASSSSLSDALTVLAEEQTERGERLEIGNAARIPDDVQVDREEQVSAAQIREAISSGAVSLNDVKRRTRTGMGLAQGRDTEFVVARMINAQAGIRLDELVPMTARPPARLVSLEALATTFTEVE